MRAIPADRVAETCLDITNGKPLQALWLAVYAQRNGWVGPPLEGHCRNGHPWTPESTYVRASGAKKCRECDRAQKMKAAA